MNKNLFSLLTPEGTLALRLGADEREAFLVRYETTLCVQYGVVIKEYVRVPASLLEDTGEFAEHFAVSYRCACSLRAKDAAGERTVPGTRRAGRGR